MDDTYQQWRYYGASPDNYVYFNCDDYSNQSSNTCEVWRIIGVFNMEGTDGADWSLVKIIRNDSIGNFFWDSYHNNNGWNDAGMRFVLNDYSIQNDGKARPGLPSRDAVWRSHGSCSSP